MSKLIYITNASLDGYIEDKTGSFDWGNPDQVFDFITELMRPIGTHLLGRRLYETMAHWDGPLEGYPPEHRDFARVWQKAEQIVFSRTLSEAKWENTRLVKANFVEEISRLKQQPGKDLIIFGSSDLAVSFMEHGLIDEYRIMVNPLALGAGKPLFKGLRGRYDLKLLKTKAFGSGNVLMYYQPAVLADKAA